MKLKERIEAFGLLREFLLQFVHGSISPKAETLNYCFYDEFEQVIETANVYNQWFIKDFVKVALENIVYNLEIEKLSNWLLPYKSIDTLSPKNIGVIMAGNIPLVGFHDFLSVLIAGHKFYGKQSSKDNQLIQLIAKILFDIQPRFKDKIQFVDSTLTNIDAVIATGSNNTARYFEYYFGKYPNIIRKNRNSIAVLDGRETEEDLKLLAEDVFLYFGLGCRNVSKIYVPTGYNFYELINAFQCYGHFIHHKKYRNNLDYNKTLCLMNKSQFIDGGFFLLLQDYAIASPIATIYYEEYSSMESLKKLLNLQKQNIQCVVSKLPVTDLSVKPGEAQKPMLDDYADGINTLDFLINL